MRGLRGIGLALLVSLAACSQHQAAESAAGGAASPVAAAPAPQAGAFLAYEHSVTVTLGEREIPTRLATVQASCLAQTFGECVLLDVQQRGGEEVGGKLVMRIAPKGVDSMIRQAGQGGEVSDRTTHAEDLADAVQATTVQGDRLTREHAKLLEFEGRSNLTVADMLVLSKQLADVESQLDATQQDAAQQHRRISTNLLTIDFQLPVGASGRSDVGQAFRDFGGILASATAFLIRALAALIPVAIVLLGLLMLWRWRRRKSRPSQA